MNREFKSNLLQLKQWAFTLAETLIVMGIIGVVAALTLPNLNSSTGEKEKVAKLQKIYSNLQDAYGRAIAIYGPQNEWCTKDEADCEKKVFDRITEFIKYSKICTVNDACSLFGGNTSSGGVRSNHAVILADGATVGIYAPYSSSLNSAITYYIDLDGPNKGPNQNCKDYFTVYSYPRQGISISPTYNDSVPNLNKTTEYTSSATCANWVIRNGNMDYLKVNSNDECPNGTILSNTNTTCK